MYMVIEYNDLGNDNCGGNQVVKNRLNYHHGIQIVSS